MSRLIKGLMLAGLMLASASQAQTVEYIHTDALGSVVAVTNAQRKVQERREYEPYGHQLTPAVSNGPGYTGHVQDAATGLVYMQQRYYDPVVGRFLSTDPVPVVPGARNFNRYAYAANNPYTFVDPDGRDCKHKDGTTTCSVPITGSRIPRTVSFPTPGGVTGKENHTRSSPAYHAYGYGTPHKKADGAVQDSIIRNPTPGKDNPATPEGTPNNATPPGGRGLLARAGVVFGNSAQSPVKSYSFQDAEGNKWAINVTQPGHGLHFGYVLRGSVDGVALSIGEGWAVPQVIPGLKDIINSVWINHNQRNIDDAR